MKIVFLDVDGVLNCSTSTSKCGRFKCVLDDDIFADYEKYGILPYLLKTDYFKDGLTEEIANKTILFLQK